MGTTCARKQESSFCQATKSFPGERENGTFVPSFSREFKASYKHLNLTKHGFMSFITAPGKQRAGLNSAGRSPRRSNRVIKGIYKDFQWGCCASCQSHSTLHVLPWCVAHCRSIKLIQSCSTVWLTQHKDGDETAEITQALQGLGSVPPQLAAPAWAEGPGEVRTLEDLMLGGREEIGGGGVCRDLSWEGESGSGNTHKLFCHKSDLGLELIPSFRSDLWSVGGLQLHQA